VPLIALLSLLAAAHGPGMGIVGTASPELPRLRWVQGGPLRLSDLRGKVVLVRFFMDDRCPLCRGTAPALNEFHREFRDKGLVVIGIYTPKPRPRPTVVKEVKGYVEALGFRFPIAVDDAWSALRRLWLDRVPEAEYTSASLLIDRKGVVRHVQPGGLYARDAPDSQGRRDYRVMRDEIVALLNER
jgi:peroxiredoxin